MFEHNWTILGDNPFAEQLRAAAPFVPSPTPITIATEGTSVSSETWVAGPAAIHSDGERVVPFYSAFEAIEEVKRALGAGEAGKVYGLFGSFRTTRDAAPANIPYDALLPILGVALDTIDEPVSRVWAANASLLSERDSWFVHLQTTSEILITLEAMPCCEPSLGRELLVEVTAHDRVLRAEPMRQAVIVEPVGKAPETHPWWEDLAERYLRLVIARNERPAGEAGSRLRAVWQAIQDSASGGQPVTLG